MLAHVYFRQYFVVQRSVMHPPLFILVTHREAASLEMKNIDSAFIGDTHVTYAINHFVY